MDGKYVDATVMGNLARFANHACRPNAWILKWEVDDRVCIGFFACRDIACGEEVIIDYDADWGAS